MWRLGFHRLSLPSLGQKAALLAKGKRQEENILVFFYVFCDPWVTLVAIGSVVYQTSLLMVMVTQILNNLVFT